MKHFFAFTLIFAKNCKQKFVITKKFIVQKNANSIYFYRCLELFLVKVEKQNLQKITNYSFL